MTANLTHTDYKKLLLSSMMLLMVLLAMMALVHAAQTRKQASMLALENQKIALQQATQRYQSSGVEKANIIKYLPQYQQLLSKGLVDEERRLAWVDALRNIHKNGKLFSIQYNIGAQEAYKLVFPVNLGQFKITRSLMKLELAMLHEGDLITLLNGLSTQQSAPFMVRQCEMTRQNASIDSSLIDSSLAPNIQAKCELDWITIHLPSNAAAEQIPQKAQGQAR